jgi:uracil-DNA glycosylase family 4
MNSNGEINTLLNKVERYLSNQADMYGNIQFQPANTKATSMSKIQTNDNSALDSITSLMDLELFCRNQNILKTDLPDTNLVFGKGNPQADLMLIGEAPGAEEDKLGEPFVGRSGQLLTKILQAIQFERDQIYIANILKHRPPDNRNPTSEERERSLPYLKKQIEIINPKIILCLGKVSAETLLNIKSTMKDMRGVFHNFGNNHELLVTYHPAALLRNPNWKRETWEDVQLLRKRYNELGCKP